MNWEAEGVPFQVVKLNIARRNPGLAMAHLRDATHLHVSGGIPTLNFVDPLMRFAPNVRFLRVPLSVFKEVRVVVFAEQLRAHGIQLGWGQRSKHQPVNATWPRVVEVNGSAHGSRGRRIWAKSNSD